MEPSSAPWRAIDTVEPQAGSPPEPQARPWLAVAAIAVAVAVAVAAFIAVARPSAGVAVEGTATSAAGLGRLGGTGSPGPATSSRELIVEVGGAVAHPGVYRLPAGSRVGDAVDAAGGFGPRVDARAADQSLNLAALLEDGQEIHVPARDEVAPSSAGSASGATRAGGADGGLVDLNRATAEALDALPGVGPATAAKIIAAREEQPFASVDDLATRKVVGQATLAKIRALVTAGG